MKYSIFILAILMACSPTQKKDDTLKQNKFSVLEESFMSGVVIFPQDESITLSSVSDKANKLLKQFRKADEIPDSISYDGYHILFAKPGDAEFNMPKADEIGAALQHLTEDEINLLPKTKANIVFSFFGTRANVISKQREVNELVYSIIENKKAFALDLNSFELFTPLEWRKSRIDNFKTDDTNMTGQVALHLYREDEFCRIVTMGMNKFCLPELSIKSFTCSDGNTFGSLVNATIQSLYENPFLYGDSTFTIDLDKIRNDEMRQFIVTDLRKNAARQATIQLRYVVPEQGDNPSQQLRILFIDDDQSTSQVKANALVANLFGADDSLTYADHDEKLLEASENAKRKLPEMQERFKQGLEPGYSIMVKIPFKTDDGGNEWMWVEVTKWNTSQMKGILQNDPYKIKDLKAGASVEFDEADIFDYILNKPDGSFEGNETGKLIENQN